MLFRSDKFRSFSSRNLFRGAAVLTAAGLITRIMGFFFRIFLSHAFGEENVGLYQLIFAVSDHRRDRCLYGFQCDAAADAVNGRPPETNSRN